MRIGIRDRATGEIASFYTDDAPNQANFGGPWADPNLFEHVVTPFTLDELKANLKAKLEGDARRKQREREYQASPEAGAYKTVSTKINAAKTEAEAEKAFAEALK